jgi:hypothetical protein
VAAQKKRLMNRAPDKDLPSPPPDDNQRPATRLSQEPTSDWPIRSQQTIVIPRKRSKIQTLK